MAYIGMPEEQLPRQLQAERVEQVGRLQNAYPVLKLFWANADSACRSGGAQQRVPSGHLELVIAP